jgi:hypothetical protein
VVSDPLLKSAGRPSCLVLMPMYSGFEEVRAEVVHALRQGGFAVVRLEAEIPDSAWHLWLLDAVDRCDIALVDLKGAARGAIAPSHEWQAASAKESYRLHQKALRPRRPSAALVSEFVGAQRVTTSTSQTTVRPTDRDT